MSFKNKSTVESDLQLKQEPTDEESLIEFPCEFAVKVMGATSPEFHTTVEKIAVTHDTDFDTSKTTQKISKTGKYVSLTLIINAKNKPQLDAIYKDLTDSELVLWAL